MPGWGRGGGASTEAEPGRPESRNECATRPCRNRENRAFGSRKPSFIRSVGEHVFVNSHSTNQKGSIAELKIAAAAAELGVPVLAPMTEHGRYDLAFEVGGQFLRVQCKSAARKGGGRHRQPGVLPLLEPGTHCHEIWCRRNRCCGRVLRRSRRVLPVAGRAGRGNARDPTAP
jgi:hypothetical protein